MRCQRLLSNVAFVVSLSCQTPFKECTVSAITASVTAKKVAGDLEFVDEGAPQYFQNTFIAFSDKKEVSTPCFVFDLA